ncbi:hypothetical protein SIN01_27220 [Sporolactobacillus inulinus]|nr:hypothetical protein [Sporolactobacillus inulinus]GEB78377.1 hypothetical protein SIN01_27220 [Sporolactobacillus inulinus]
MYQIIPETQNLLSVPGIGRSTPPNLSLRAADSTTIQLAEYAEFYWKMSQSDHSRTHTDNEYLRYYLIEAANSVENRGPAYRAYC